MSATIVSRSSTGIVIQVTVAFHGSMLEAENAIQDAVNSVGQLATAEQLQHFDADGSPLLVGDTKLTTKGLFTKEYLTPYGPVEVDRHLYQTNQGGKTFCPLEQKARIILSATPRLAQILSHKYADIGARQVVQDLTVSHGWSVAASYVQKIAETVASAVQAKEEVWSYALPKLPEPVATVSIGLDGTCLLMAVDGWRETMVGTISLLDAQGNRMHTIYTAATPEYGKETFLERLEGEIDRVKVLYPKAEYVGLADGTASNWTFLKRFTTTQVVDYYHAVNYLAKVAERLHPRQVKQRKEWLESRCERLKNEEGAAKAIAEELNRLAKLRPEEQAIEKAATYYENQQSRMEYAKQLAAKRPIGSGVTEAGCKVIVKQRLCGSGMRWKEEGAASVLSLRCLSHTTERWQQFWSKVDQYGFPIAA